VVREKAARRIDLERIMAFDSSSRRISSSTELLLDKIEELYRTHADDLVAFASTFLKGREWDAEDVVQDAFLELLERPMLPENAAKFLRGVVRRKCAAL
jgi:DNA-directed RNA polymerase specialized sigma24 family protein